MKAKEGQKMNNLNSVLIEGEVATTDLFIWEPESTVYSCQKCGYRVIVDGLGGEQPPSACPECGAEEET